MNLDGSKATTPEISVIIPAYNEAARIAEPLQKVMTYLAEKFSTFELIVVDDGSQDETLAVVRRLAETCPELRWVEHPRNLGKGAAVRTGMLASKGKWVLFSDADGAIPIEELEQLAPKLGGATPIVIGSKGLETTHGVTRGVWYRVAMGRFFNLFCRLLLVPGFRDTQCGFKLFDGPFARKLFPLQKLHNFAFDLEILFLAKQLGVQVAEVPVRWANIRGSRVNVVRDSIKMFFSLFVIRWKHPSYKKTRQKFG